MVLFVRMLSRFHRGFFSEFFTPYAGTTFDENSVPPFGQGGTSGGFELGNNHAPALPAAVAVVRSVADKHRTPTTPGVAVDPGIPSSSEEESLS